MLDCVDTRLHRGPQTLDTMCVGGDPAAEAVGGIDGGPQLLEGVLLLSGPLAWR